MEQKQNLDRLLNYFKNFDSTDKEASRKEWKEMSKDFKPHFERYLKKLRDDGMIEDVPNPQISFDGLFFVGYEQQAMNERANESSIKRAAEQIRKLNIWLNVATWTASILLLISFCWDVFKYYYPVVADGETIINQIGIFFLIFGLL